MDVLLAAHFEDLGLAGLGLGGGWSTTVLTPSFTTSRHVVALTYASGARVPSVVTKIPRRPGDECGIRREARVLGEVAATGAAGDGQVPRVLGLLPLGSRQALVQSALSGRPVDPRRVVQDTGLVVQAGLGFVSSLPITGPAAHDWYERAVAGPLALLVAHCPADEALQRLVIRTHAATDGLRGALVPAVLEHGDLGHPNLLLDASGRLQVLDWERAGTAGVPGHDLVFFLQYVAESLAGAYDRPAQVRAFEGAFGHAGSWGRELLAEHLESRGVAPDLLPELLLLAWARCTSTLVDRLSAARPTAGGPDDQVNRALATDRDFLLWQQALAMCERES